MKYKKIIIIILFFPGMIMPLPSFNLAMQPSNYYTPSLIHTNPQWLLIKQLYDTYLLNPKYASQPRIPNIIHQIWLGSSLPERYQLLQQTWRDKHPDWQYFLWTEQEIEQFGLTNYAAYAAATNYGEKSDIARYEILYRFGGLYVDTDFMCIQPFDMLHHCCDFYAGVAYGRVVSLYNGLIGAAPGHPVLSKCIESIAHNVPSTNTMLAILQRTGPLFFTHCFFDVIATCTGRSIILPVSYCYPIPEDQRLCADYNSWLKPETIAVHFWHMAWLS